MPSIWIKCTNNKVRFNSTIYLLIGLNLCSFHLWLNTIYKEKCSTTWKIIEKHTEWGLQMHSLSSILMNGNEISPWVSGKLLITEGFMCSSRALSIFLRGWVLDESALFISMTKQWILSLEPTSKHCWVLSNSISQWKLHARENNSLF